MDMQTTITFNPLDLQERDSIRHLLDVLDSAAPTVEDSPMPLDELVAVLLDKEKYGHTRKSYAGLVALNSPEATPGPDVMKIVASTLEEGKDTNKAVGGAHRSLEQSWKSLGGQAYSPVFIRTDASGAHSMDPDVAEAVKGYLVDELLALRKQLKGL